MENKVVRRLAVSSSGWLGGGRWAQETRETKVSEEKGRRCIPGMEPKLPSEREENLAAYRARGTGSGAVEGKPRLRGPDSDRSRKGGRSRKRNKLAKSAAIRAANWGNVSSAYERAKPPNENKMSDGGRERASLQVEAF
jgi:hypothetical protein